MVRGVSRGCVPVPGGLGLPQAEPQVMGERLHIRFLDHRMVLARDVMDLDCGGERAPAAILGRGDLDRGIGGAEQGDPPGIGPDGVFAGQADMGVEEPLQVVQELLDQRQGVSASMSPSFCTCCQR